MISEIFRDSLRNLGSVIGSREVGYKDIKFVDDHSLFLRVSEGVSFCKIFSSDLSS